MLLHDAELKEPPSGIHVAKGAGPGSALQRAAEGLHPTAAVMPILTKALDSQNPDVRRVAVILLGRVGPDAKSTAPALIAAANDAIRAGGDEDKHEGPEYSDYASAIAQIVPAEEAISILSPAIGNDHRAVRTAAAAALGKLGPKVRPPFPSCSRP